MTHLQSRLCREAELRLALVRRVKLAELIRREKVADCYVTSNSMWLAGNSS